MSAPTLHYAWQSPDIRTPFDLSSFSIPVAEVAAFFAWRMRLADDRPLVVQSVTCDGPVLAMMECFHNKSSLLVPIFIGEKLSGCVSIDSCSSAREWTTSEIDTLRSFGDIAGSLFVHDETRIALEKSERRFSVLTETAHDAIITTNRLR